MTAIHDSRTTSYRSINWFESGSGTPLLLVNGWTASALVWPQEFLRRLEEHHRVIRIDTRGGGHSRAAATPFRMADLAGDAHRLLHDIGAAPATVLGFSLGGMIAQELAVRHPSDVSRLILVSTSPPAPAALRADDSITWHMFRRRRAGETYRAYLYDLWARAAAPGFPERRPDLMDELIEQLAARPTTRFAAMAQARAAGSWYGPRRLSRITAPTTVLHGRDDVLRPVGNGMRLARLIPGARYIEFPDAGHLLPLEAMDELLAVIEEDQKT
ncbi:MAG TPA: alpha/beta fold hydrolase [Jatrophihabitantaceae bacterium]|nr:alpha/beta fold hydrolase [Jatrophihabitantaceae bacterium]